VVHRRPCWQHLAFCSVNSRQKSYIGSESRFLPTPPAFDTGVRGGSRRNIATIKTRMAWLPEGEKSSKISLFILTQSTNVTNGQTQRQTHGHRMATGRAYASYLPAKIAIFDQFMALQSMTARASSKVITLSGGVCVSRRRTMKCQHQWILFMTPSLDIILPLASLRHQSCLLCSCP